jgi:hypothetical protein
MTRSAHLPAVPEEGGAPPFLNPSNDGVADVITGTRETA